MAKTNKTAIELALESADRLRKTAMREPDVALHVLMTRHYSALMQMHAERLAIAADGDNT